MLVADQMYHLECDDDACTARIPGDGWDYVAMADPVTLIEQAIDNEWLIYQGKHYCDNHVAWCEECEESLVPWKIRVCDDCREEDAALTKEHDQYTGHLAEKGISNHG